MILHVKHLVWCLTEGWLPRTGGFLHSYHDIIVAIVNIHAVSESKNKIIFTTYL